MRPIRKLAACQILIPALPDKTRQPWPQDLVDGWGASAVERFGGITMIGIVGGLWRDDDGMVVADASRCYLIAVEPARVDDVREFAREACAIFEQRCIYFQIVGEAELLYPEKS